MNEQIWYVYQNGQQVGPFDTPQVTQLFVNKMIAKDGYIFKVGWKEWRPIEEGYEELGLTPPEGSSVASDTLEKRRAQAPRATVAGRVVVHNDGQLSIGNGVNISATGIFVETRDQIFTVGEQLKLSVKVESFPKPFNAVAQVIRYNSDPRFPVGYGLRFEIIDEHIKKDIQALVERTGETGRKKVVG